MINPLKALIQMGVIPSVTFPTDSRYYGSSTLSYVAPSGQMITYLARRFVPQPGAPNFATVAQHTVKQGDRLDLVAAKYLGDPLMFWLICDANGAIQADNLVETPGTVLNITMPQGVPGGAMLDSVQLSLMIGPVIPLTPPRAVMDALAEVEVKAEDVGQSGFKLTFSIDKQSPLQILFLLTGGMPLLFMRVVIVATVNGVSNVLIDGVITENHISPGDKGSNSTLTLMGKDLTALMDQSNWSGFPFPACPAEARVALILLKYALFGVIPLVIPSVLLFVPLPIDQIPSQQGTDLQYIRYLAEQAGYVFYIDPGPIPGVSKAYWGPQIKVGPVQPALSADMDAYTNVESLHFSFDQERNKLPLLYIYNSETGVSIPIPLPPITPLNPPLGLIPPLPTNLLPPDLSPFRDDLSKRPIPQAIMMGLAAAAQNAEAVSCEGSLDVTRYRGVLKARQLVGVRGAGPAFDGLYYVKSVTHKIKRGEYKQDFTLTRNGLVSTVPTVNL